MDHQYLYPGLPDAAIFALTATSISFSHPPYLSGSRNHPIPLYVPFVLESVVIPPPDVLLLHTLGIEIDLSLRVLFSIYYILDATIYHISYTILNLLLYLFYRIFMGIFLSQLSLMSYPESSPSSYSY